MSAATAAPAPAPAGRGTLDLSGTHRVPLGRLVKVELRKMGDTRAGMWLLIAMAAISVLVTLGVFIWGSGDDRGFLNLLSFAGIPQAQLLPVLGILLVTSEWGQRTALVTFTQVPARSRVLTAKLVAAVLFALAGFVVAVVVALVLTPIGGASDPWAHASAGFLARIVLGLLIGIVWGLAFGSAFLNSAFAIVLYFLVPTILGILGAIWKAGADKLAWVDLGTSSGRLFDWEAMTGKHWAQLATGFIVFVVLPGAYGTWRILRSEVK